MPWFSSWLLAVPGSFCLHGICHHTGENCFRYKFLIQENSHIFLIFESYLYHTAHTHPYSCVMSGPRVRDHRKLTRFNLLSGPKIIHQDFPGGPVANTLRSQCKPAPRFDPWVRKIPWRREWLPTPVFLSGEFHGQRSLVGYSWWDHTELNTTERLTLSLSPGN